MQVISDFKDINMLDDNTIYADAEKSVLKNSNVRFVGKNSILYVEDGVTLQGQI